MVIRLTCSIQIAIDLISSYIAMWSGMNPESSPSAQGHERWPCGGWLNFPLVLSHLQCQFFCWAGIKFYPQYRFQSVAAAALSCSAGTGDDDPLPSTGICFLGKHIHRVSLAEHQQRSLKRVFPSFFQGHVTSSLSSSSSTGSFVMLNLIMFINAYFGPPTQID